MMTQSTKGRLTMSPVSTNQIRINTLFVLLFWLSLVLIGQQIWGLVRNLNQDFGASAASRQALQINAGPPAVLLLNADALAIPSNGGQVTLTARVRDAEGKAVAGTTVSFQSAQGTLTPATIQTDAAGAASVTFTAGASAGQAIVTATVGDFTQTAAIQIVQPNRAAPRTLALEPGKVQIPTGQQTALTIQLRNAAGQPVAGELVTFFAALGTVNPASAVTDANGRASANFQAGNRAGQGLITALAGEASHSVNVQVGDPVTPPIEGEHFIYLPVVTR